MLGSKWLGKRSPVPGKGVGFGEKTYKQTIPLKNLSTTTPVGNRVNFHFQSKDFCPQDKCCIGIRLSPQLIIVTLVWVTNPDL